MISESQMKLLKRNRRVIREDLPEEDKQYFENDGSSYYYNNSSSYRDYIVKLITLPEGPHAPNRNESREMRKICSKTGLTPQEVRQIETYRKQLAVASRSGHKSKEPMKSQYLCKLFRQQLMEELGNLHPLSKEFRGEFIKRWEEQSKNLLFSRIHWISGSDAYLYSFKHPHKIKTANNY